MKDLYEYQLNGTLLLGNNKGTHAVVNVTKNYHPGVYAISKFQKVLPETRSIIAASWRDDCLWTSKLTGYNYPACH